MRGKKLTCLAVTMGLLGSGCSMVKERVGWREANPKEVSRFVSRVQPARGNPDAHYRVASYYQDSGDHRRAIEAFKKTLSCDPTHVKAYNGLGISYDQLGDFTRAMESYQAALKIDARLDFVYNNLGYSYLMQERVEEAIEAFDRAVRLNGREERYRYNLGLAYAMKIDFDRAFEAFKTVAGEMKAYERLALFCEKQGLPYLAAEYRSKARAAASTPGGSVEGRTARAAVEPAGERKGTDGRETAISVNPAPEPVAAGASEPAQQEQGKDGDRRVTEQTLPAIGVVSEIPTETPATKANLPEPKPRPSMKKIGIEVSNGNGVSQMASKVGTYLKGMGMEVVRLTNANHYAYEKTKVIFVNGYQTEAEYVAEQLPAVDSQIEAVKKMDRPNIRVKVLIGKDLIPHKTVFSPEPKRIASSPVGAQAAMR